MNGILKHVKKLPIINTDIMFPFFSGLVSRYDQYAVQDKSDINIQFKKLNCFNKCISK